MSAFFHLFSGSTNAVKARASIGTEDHGVLLKQDSMDSPKVFLQGDWSGFQLSHVDYTIT